jgi:hypothetical protein
MPMVFTSTSGGPTSAAIRWTTARAAAVVRVGRLAPDAARQLLQRLLAAVDPDRWEPGGRQLLRCHTAELTPSAGHDRRMVAHAAISVETAAKTDVNGASPSDHEGTWSFRTCSGSPPGR